MEVGNGAEPRVQQDLEVLKLAQKGRARGGGGCLPGRGLPSPAKCTAQGNSVCSMCASSRAWKNMWCKVAGAETASVLSFGFCD